MITILADDNGQIMVALYDDLMRALSDRTIDLMRENLTCGSCGDRFQNGPCACGEIEGDSFLHHFHTQNFGSGGNLWGMFRSGGDQWKQVNDSILRDRQKFLSLDPRLARIGHMDGYESVQNWIDSTHEDNGLIVKPIIIPNRPEPKKAQKKLFKIYSDCFRESESQLHAQLKWLAYSYLHKNDPYFYFEPLHFGGTGFEVSYALPGARFLKDYDGGKGSVVPPTWQDRWDWSAWIPKIADVYSYSEKCFVECGFTNAQSLVAPILAKIVKKVVWIPYPQNVSTDRCLADDEVPAYVIHRTQPKHLRSRA